MASDPDGFKSRGAMPHSHLCDGNKAVLILMCDITFFHLVCSRLKLVPLDAIQMLNLQEFDAEAVALNLLTPRKHGVSN